MIFPLKPPFIGSFPHDCPIKKHPGSPSGRSTAVQNHDVRQINHNETTNELSPYIYYLCVMYIVHDVCYYIHQPHIIYPHFLCVSPI